MKKNKFAAIFLLLAMLVSLLCATSASALTEPEVSAPNIVLADTATGEVLFTRDETARVYPASLTKIMTVLLAVEAIERGETTLTTPVMASGNITKDLEIDGSTAGITAGEILTLEGLLQCALVASANEACNVIAEHISGSMEAFVNLMNTRAAELGCTDTHFANTHGLPNENHYTTAWDLYLISRQAISHEIIREICAMKEVTVPATEGSDARTLRNTNALLGDNQFYTGYYYEGASGLKTGHTSAAGYCLAATVERDGIELLSIVMGAKATERGDGWLDVGSFEDTVKLYDWAFANYSYREILRTTEVVADLPIEMGTTDVVSVRPQNSVTALIPNDLSISVFDRSITYYHEQNGEPLVAPLSAGDVLGEIVISRDGKIYGRTALVSTKSITLSRMEYIKSEIRGFFRNTVVRIIIIVLVLLVLGYAALVVRYHILRRAHVRSVQAARRERDRRAAEVAAQATAEEEQRRAFVDDKPAIVPDDPFWPDAPEEESASAGEGASTAPAERDYFEEFFKN